MKQRIICIKRNRHFRSCLFTLFYFIYTSSPQNRKILHPRRLDYVSIPFVFFFSIPTYKISTPTFRIHILIHFSNIPRYFGGEKNRIRILGCRRAWRAPSSMWILPGEYRVSRKLVRERKAFPGIVQKLSNWKLPGFKSSISLFESQRQEIALSADKVAAHIRRIPFSSIDYLL